MTSLIGLFTIVFLALRVGATLLGFTLIMFMSGLPTPARAWERYRGATRGCDIEPALSVIVAGTALVVVVILKWSGL